MSICFKPTAGQVALIELDELDEFDRPSGHPVSPLTAMVDDAGPDVLTLMGLSSPDLTDGTEVVVSIFAPEALYRIRAAAHWAPFDKLAIEPIHDVERIERRSSPRRSLKVNVTLAALDGPGNDLSGVAGRTLDVGVAGLRVETIRRLPPGADLTVMLTLPMVAASWPGPRWCPPMSSDDGCEYRLAFDSLDDIDTARLMALVGTQTGAGTT